MEKKKSLFKDQLTLLVHKICIDYINNVDYRPEFKELLEYVELIISNLYDKAFIKKNIYIEILSQYISYQFRDYCDNYNHFIENDNTKIVDELKNIPYIEQRSNEWFKLKEDSIGASESAAIFNKSAFCSKNELLLKKCGLKKNNSIATSHACLHGTKYEPVVQLLYEINKQVKLNEFGSLLHPEFEMVSASPDGITDKGIMIEIKVPIKRKITGIPPIYYWIQMQQQMQVCNLDQVHYVECKISEYLNKDAYFKDILNLESMDEPFNSNGFYKNCIIEFHNLEKDDVGWIYPEKFMNNKELLKWEIDMQNTLRNTTNKLYSRTIYWKIEEFSISPIWRDDIWWNNNKHLYTEFWGEVTHYRKVGYESLIKKYKKPTIKRNKCLIIEDK